MSNQRFKPEFKDEAVRQVVERGYSVKDVAERVGVSAHSLYKWVKALHQVLSRLDCWRLGERRQRPAAIS